MRYKALLMDADMTLYDFEAAERTAIGCLFDELGIDDPEAPKVYSRFSEACWRDLEKGLLTQDELQVKRFRDLFAYYHLPHDAKAASERFADHLSRQSQLLPDVLEVMQKLAALLPVSIVTNGIPKVQHGRFDRSPLRPLVRDLVISGEVGFFKPDPRLIELALDRLGIAKEDALMIGDSLSSDILCAQNARVDACWLNPHGKPCTLADPPEYTIASLNEIFDILEA